MTNKEIEQLLAPKVPTLPDNNYSRADVQAMEDKLYGHWSNGLTRLTTCLREALIDAGVPEEDAKRFAKELSFPGGIGKLRDYIFKVRDGWEVIKEDKR
jgi:hypothetical protein